MGAPLKKQVSADGQNFDLEFKFGTMRMAEQELGRPLTATLAEGLGFNEVSAIFWAALYPVHRLTREATDDLIDTIGGSAVTMMVFEAVTAVFGAGSEQASVGEAKAGKVKAK